MENGWNYGNYWYNGQQVDNSLLNSVGGNYNTYVNKMQSDTTSPVDYMARFKNNVNRTKEKSLWDIFSDGMYNNFKENPTGFVGGLINGGGNLWGAYEQYRNNKKALAAQQEAYELQKQLALNAERRNQEQWDMTKRQRASSSL